MLNKDCNIYLICGNNSLQCTCNKLHSTNNKKDYGRK